MKWQDATSQPGDGVSSFKNMNASRTMGSMGMIHPLMDTRRSGYISYLTSSMMLITRLARCVVDGHLTDVPINRVYSGVVFLYGLCTIAFLFGLNDLKMWATDIGNAYLKAFTSKKLCIITHPEFVGDIEGHMLVIFKALYGLQTSGLRWWHERFLDCLHDMEFTPSKVEPDIWMRHIRDHYEYITEYEDDITIASKDPNTIIDILTNVHGFKLKGTGPIECYHGMTFNHNEQGQPCISSR